MQTLYCFKLLDDFTLQKFEITDYEVKIHAYTRKAVYKFSEPKIVDNYKMFNVDEDKLERFVSNKVYTFNPSKENAMGIIKETIFDKLYSAEETASKYSDIANKLGASDEYLEYKATKDNTAIKRQCVYCGKEFVTSNKRKMACSYECSLNHHNQRKRAKRKLAKKIDNEEYMEMVHENDQGVVDCAKKAKELGVSYGQYMAMKAAGKV